MNQLNQVKQLAAHFSLFQGLKGVPLGLLLMVLSLWASAQDGPVGLFFPIAISIVLFSVYWVVDRFYVRTFGVAVQEKGEKTSRWLREGMFAIAALAAFWVDVTYWPAFSALGLVFAGAFMTDYLVIARRTGESILLAYPVAALLMLVLSLAPLFEINWWLPLGIKALILGICSAAGLAIAIQGILLHIALENLLMVSMEVIGE